jgi:hypothetical protein
VLAAKHLLGLGGFNLLLERIQRPLEIGGDVFPALHPLEQDAEIVDLLGEAVAQFEVLGETALTLQRLLCFGLVVPEIRGGDLLFELR